ncbi:MAG: T9SS type A sorting domain-containing protein [Saprospiraceae bacterium]|nr:T9SS type A sorting domain-containing protein [Saprospiraceae bacterium]
MRIKIFLFNFLLGMFGLATTSSSQTQTVYQVIDITQGQVLPILNLDSETFPANVTFAPEEGNEVEVISLGGDAYMANYIPAPDFLGTDYFAIEVYESFNPFIPDGTVKITYAFSVNVMASMVKSHDDFIHLTTEEEITIDVLSNDESSSEDLTVSIAQIVNGTAVVNEDQTITYTPADDAPDYIVYSVMDELNTSSSSTVYISHESDVEEGFEQRSYVIASGNSQYIILPNSDFTISTEDYELGEIVQLNDFVYEYTAKTNIDGVELINFTDDEDNTYQAAIEIIEKYTDEGFVKDDIFYSASNTSIDFNVSDNDITDQYVITDYSEDLIYNGQGEFSYTPTPYFSGIKTFTYTADDGFTEEVGIIELVISNFKPTNYFEYNLATPQNQPRVIEYTVPLGTEYFEIASLALHGTVEIFTDEESVDAGCEEGIQKVFALYTPDNDFIGTDDFTIRYCASDNNICNDVSIALEVIESTLDECICIDDCVWPGDANGDGKVSVVDALSIGRFIGLGGPAREASLYGEMYEGSSAENWFNDQVNGKNLKHVDADGDGHITTADLDVVAENYGDINSIISEDILGVKNIPFILTSDAIEIDSGATIVINVIIGTDENPAIDIHGVSFAVNIDPDIIDSETVEVEYLETGYLVKDAPYVHMTHVPEDGIIHTAGTKSNALGSTGSGIVATVSFIVEETADGIKTDKKRSVNDQIGDIVSTIRATDIVIEDSKGFKYALPNASLDISLKNNNETAASIHVYPNPSSEIINVASKDGSNLTSIKVYNMDGRLEKSTSQINKKEGQVRIGSLSTGIYIIQVESENGLYSEKFIKN